MGTCPLTLTKVAPWEQFPQTLRAGVQRRGCGAAGLRAEPALPARVPAVSTVLGPPRGGGRCRSRTAGPASPELPLAGFCFPASGPDRWQPSSHVISYKRPPPFICLFTCSLLRAVNDLGGSSSAWVILFVASRRDRETASTPGAGAHGPGGQTAAETGEGALQRDYGPGATCLVRVPGPRYTCASCAELGTQLRPKTGGERRLGDRARAAWRWLFRGLFTPRRPVPLPVPRPGQHRETPHAHRSSWRSHGEAQAAQGCAGRQGPGRGALGAGRTPSPREGPRSELVSLGFPRSYPA